MRVLSIANHFPPGYTGGAEVVNLHTGLGLMERGMSYSVLCLNNRTAQEGDDRYSWQGIPVRRIQVQRNKRPAWLDLFDPRLYRATIAEVQRLRPDIVHFHNVAGATLAPFVACARLKVPVVTTLHDLWLLCPNNMRYRDDGSYCDPRQYPEGCGHCARRADYWADVPRRRRTMMALTRGVDRFISPSQALIERHVEAGYDRERFRLARHGFPVPSTDLSVSPSLAPLLADEPHRPTVFFAGGGVESKGAQVVIEAIPLLVQYIPDIRIVIAGAAVPSVAQQLQGFGPAVHFLGPIPYHEMLALFSVADLTLVPSVWHENLPVVISESYQMGTPVVGSAIGGIPELIEEGQTGYLFPPRDAVALVERVVTHFARPARDRRQMALRCVAKIREELTDAHYLDTLEAIYDEVLGR